VAIEAEGDRFSVGRSVQVIGDDDTHILCHV
jgi:hypothetical protein